MRRAYNALNMYTVSAAALVLIAVIVIIITLSGESPPTLPVQGPAPAPKQTPTPMPTPKPTIFVTHTIVNPGQLPLRATILARDDLTANFDAIELFIDSSGGYEKTVCKSLPCRVDRNYTQPGTVKYYATATKGGESASDPADAPRAYKSFRVG